MSDKAPLRGAIEKFAPRWIDPPVLQPAGLYLELSGEEIRRRAFLVADENGAELCLRPDMTVPALRFALEQGLTGVIAYEGLVFRRQQQGSARETEFVQLGAEWLGDSDDSEIVACALEACRAASASPGLKLGDLALVHAFIASCGLAAPWVERMKRAVQRPHGIDALKAEIARDDPLEGGALADALAAAPEEDAEAALADLLAVARITPVGSRSLADIARRLRARGEAHRAPKPAKEQIALIEMLTHLDSAVEKGIAAVEKLLTHRCVEGDAARTAFDAALVRLHKLENAVDLPKDARFAPGLGRGLAYYDGFVFELEARGLGPRASLGGGGRYDGLVKRLMDRAPQNRARPILTFEGRSAQARIGGAHLETSKSGAPGGARSVAGAGFALRPARIAEAAK